MSASALILALGLGVVPATPTLDQIVRLGEEAVMPEVAAPTLLKPAETRKWPVVESQTPQGFGSWIAIGAIAAAAAIALRLRRRKLGDTRYLEVLERTSLARNRELLVVRVDGEVMLLSSSERGTSVLREGLKPPPKREAIKAPRFLDTLTGALSRGGPRLRLMDEDEDEGLVEPEGASTEDAEIRRKLQLHLGARNLRTGTQA